MKLQRILLLLLVTACLPSLAQNTKTMTIGFPDRSPNLDVLPGFKTPPKGYGDVAFYWWIGDTLTKERLTYQLDQLKGKGITGLQVNYCHTDAGGATYGLTFPSKPVLFSKAWWDLFGWFLKEAQKRDMAVSLSDYTLGAAGQGWFVDEMLAENPTLNGSKLESKQYDLTSDQNFKYDLTYPLVSATAFPLTNNKLERSGAIDLTSKIENGTLNWKAPAGNWRLIAIYANTVKTSFDPMNPLSGQKIIEKFYQRFEDHNPGEAGKGLNFFFSDELQFGIRGFLWNTRFASEFLKRKGYDIRPELSNLFVDLSPRSQKIRLDYNDVMVSLTEESFFKPVFNWHESRGMLFGCDHGGRGRDLTEFGDYFRTQRWMSGPGSDQPHLAKDLIKAKVASSIAHLYNRQRVWLEGFYGSGWGTSTADITDAMFANFAMGYNLLSLHGLYYTTKGGWWEWAPPCNHFHMPYWNQMNPFMDCTQRLSYLLSQGHHVCDVAVLYPTESVVAGIDGQKSVNTAFEAGRKLYEQGIDFDFMDYESLANASIQESSLKAAEESYKVLIVPSMKAIRYSSLKKIEEFKNKGGIVVNIGDLPLVTDKSEIDDSTNKKYISQLFTPSKSMLLCNSENELVTTIEGKYAPNFKILEAPKGQPYMMHRVVGTREVYALYNIAKGTKCFFSSKGNAQLWNPWTGETVSLNNVSKTTPSGTEITLPLTEKEMQLIVFDPSSTSSNLVQLRDQEPKTVKSIALTKAWGFQIKPSLDNQWGDFQLPAKKENLGAQVRQMYAKENLNYTGGAMSIDSTWKLTTCSFGAQFLKVGPFKEAPDQKTLINLVQPKAGDSFAVGQTHLTWNDYGFSWRYGVEGDYGHQGYHGLKGVMYDDFIRLGKLQEVKHSLRRATETEGNHYVLYSQVIAPKDGSFDMLSGSTKPLMLLINGVAVDPSQSTVNLKKGANPVVLVYDKACETYLLFRRTGIPQPAKQEVAMKWFQDKGVLPFDFNGEKSGSGMFAFKSAPNLQSLTLSAYGKVQLWADGVLQNLIQGETKEDGLTNYTYKAQKQKSGSSQILIKVNYLPGFRKGGAIPYYLEQTCGVGSIELGDWSKIDGLRAYSGGAIYHQKFALTADDVKNRVEINLGDLVSSAELRINGKSAGIRVSPPWKYDISKLVKVGENNIEVILYNTLGNNYTTIPTRYLGSIKSGLIGPVVVNVQTKN